MVMLRLVGDRDEMLDAGAEQPEQQLELLSEAFAASSDVAPAPKAPEAPEFENTVMYLPRPDGRMQELPCRVRRTSDAAPTRSARESVFTPRTSIPLFSDQRIRRAG